MQEVFKFIKSFFDQLRKLLIPPSAFSWQMLIWLSIFSWFMSLLAEHNWVKELLASGGWIFLILGVGWLTAEERKNLRIGEVPLGPWITGALVSIFLFGNVFDRFPSLVFISWPPISAFIAALPDFLRAGFRKVPEPPVRQKLVILFLVNFVISCWFQFYFSIQNWLREYPSVLSDDFSQSAFVVVLETEPVGTSRGPSLLDLAESYLKTELEGQPWAQAERSLFELRRNPSALRDPVIKQLPNLEENQLWDLKTQILPVKPDYTLQLLAVWHGPSSNPLKYYFTKTCQIVPAQTQVETRPAPTLGTTTPPTPQVTTQVLQPATVGEVACQPASDRTLGQPDLAT